MKSILRSFLFAILALPGLGLAEPVTVDITRQGAKYNLGLAPFTGDDGQVGDSILSTSRNVISDDLKFTKVFNVIDQGPVVTRRNDIAEWAKTGAEAVLSATVRARGERVEISAKLNDAASGKEVLSLNKRGLPADVRTMAHEIANEVVKYFTGQAGIFNSKIVFVNDATGRKELYVADFDGRNVRRLTNDNSIVILPRLSRDGKNIVYTSYRSGNPDLYLVSVDGSNRRRLSSKAGLNVSPSWAPNNQELAVTLSINGPPNIYLMDLSGNVGRQLTDSQGADTAPCFSPDGSQLAFTSDRASAPHIWIKNLDGTGIRRITTASHCDSAAWSPDGQTILYVKGESRNDIYSIDVQSGVERRLTWGEGNNENPSWSPDGRFILFVSTRRKKSELFIMSPDGSDPKPLFSTKGQCYTPHWGS